MFVITRVCAGHTGVKNSKTCCNITARPPIIGTMNTHQTWFAAITNGATRADVAAETGIANSTIAHQFRTGQLSATTVIAIAKAYDANVLQALVDTGFIDHEDTPLPASTDLRAVDDRALVAELARRINSRPSHWDGTFEDVFTRNGVEDPKPPLHLVEQEDPTPDVHNDPYANGAIPADAVADSSEEVGGTPDDFEY